MSAQGSLQYGFILVLEQVSRLRSFFDDLPEKPVLPLYTLISYDTLHWLAKLIAQHGTDNRKIREQIFALEYQGLFTEYKFDAFGDLSFTEFAAFHVKDSRFVERSKTK